MKEPSYTTAVSVRKPGGFIYRATCGVCRFIVGRKNKLQYNISFDPKTVKGPAVVICSHPSFVDWFYSGTAMLPNKMNFIVARYYFFTKLVGNLLRRAGAIPKSMFMPDVESAHNCWRVIKSGGILSYMPEARLSTVGRLEDIHPLSARMLKKLGVPVYAVQLNGSYFVKPKWGSGIRSGGLVEINCSQLFTAEELTRLSDSEILEAMKTALAYDDFAWLRSHPEITYRAKAPTAGLDGILYRCPRCGKEFTLTTEGDTISCECGATAKMDGRYNFISDTIPYANLQEWYDAQYELLNKQADNEDFELRCRCVLKAPSLDGKKMFSVEGEGECVLNKDGLTYTGTCDEGDGMFFPLSEIYALLFGANENFEIYSKRKYHYFAPENKRECVKWYMASTILKRKYGGKIK